MRRLSLTSFPLLTVGGALTSAFSWRSTFYFIAATGGVSLVSPPRLLQRLSRFPFNLACHRRVRLFADLPFACLPSDLLLLLPRYLETGTIPRLRKLPD